MKKSIALFLTLSAQATLFAAPSEFDSFARAKLHPLTCERPAPDFFEGALLGNGGMGVVVTTRPDAVVLHFGHNNVWDIRIAENNRAEIGTFKKIFERVNAIPDTLPALTDDPWYAEYSKMTEENYRKPYPRPFPCGSVLLGFDRRNAEMIGHRLDISDGLCEVILQTNDQKRIRLQIFTDMTADRLWMRLVDQQGNPCDNIFDRIRVMIDPSTPTEFPPGAIDEDLSRGTLSFRQILPYSEPASDGPTKAHPKDRAFRLTAAVEYPLEKRSVTGRNETKTAMARLEAGLQRKSGFIASVTLEQGLNRDVTTGPTSVESPGSDGFVAARKRSDEVWRDYWNKSGVSLSDVFLERLWYHNLYFLNCAAKESATPPGLFANWSYDKIGTAWHGDYHMNYNTQQAFWATFSSNHLEKNLPYVKLIESLMDVSRRWAREYYELPGAYFPHSAYPVDMSMSPYPVPTWGWEICETPWAVQGLWWHYLYSGDVDFLRSRAYEPLNAAVEYMVAYMQRPEARGARWGDGKYHIFPTVPPELYGLRPGFKYNYDCNADLALTKFVFKAFAEAAAILGKQDEEKELLAAIEDILSHFLEYPSTISKAHGKVLVSVPGEHGEVVYNLPLPLFTVFPGEDHGLSSDPVTFELLKRSFRNQQNEGGNDLVLINLQAARIGMLDLERFKRQVNYCLMPNGTSSDRVMQVHGRYTDTTNYGFMDRMGVWFENFGLPVVVNECLLQSYDGTVRLFPNWPVDKDARFWHLRAAGAFLVSSAMKTGKVEEIEVISEAGALLKLLVPWAGETVVENSQGIRKLNSKMIEIPTRKGEIILIRPAPNPSTRVNGTQ